MKYLICAVATLSFSFLTGCGKAPPNPAAGNAAFEKGDFKKAIEEYKKEYEGTPTDPDVVIRLAISEYETGDYGAFLRAYNLYLELSGAYKEFKPWAGAVNLLQNPKVGGMPPAEVMGYLMMNPAVGWDLPHVTKTRLIKNIAANIVRDAETAEERALALLDFIGRNIRSDIAEGEVDSPAEPVDILMRGFGVCDRSVWCYIDLARQVGLTAHMLQLRTDDPKKEAALTSPHSLVAVKIDGKYALLDTFGGFALRHPETGKLADIEDVLAHPEIADSIVEANPGYPLKSEYFKRALYAITLSPEAILPRMTVLQEMISRFSPRAKMFPQVALDARIQISEILKSGPVDDEELAKTKNPFPYTFAEREYQADIWLFPFTLSRAIRQQAVAGTAERGFKFYRGMPEAQQKSKEFYTARLHQMLSQYTSATKTYLALAKMEGPLAEPSQFNAAMCYFENEQVDQAIDAFMKYLETYPEGKMKGLAYLHLGLCHKKKGDKTAAKAALEQVSGPRRIKARILLQNLDKPSAAVGDKESAPAAPSSPDKDATDEPKNPNE